MQTRAHFRSTSKTCPGRAGGAGGPGGAGGAGVVSPAASRLRSPVSTADRPAAAPLTMKSHNDEGITCPNPYMFDKQSFRGHSATAFIISSVYVALVL